MHESEARFLQCTFAATCATIVSGAIAERCHFHGYIIFCTVMSAVIYPIPTHWAWGPQGWLGVRGFRDDSMLRIETPKMVALLNLIY